ncbi:MAG: endopeptidase La [Anaerolineaceae bacterium]|nr:endopeptidase La [Anaerolineaceae bacterium]
MTEDLINNEEIEITEDPASSEKEQTPQIKEIQNDDSDSSNIELPTTLPILPLRGLVVYPFTAVPLTVGQPRSIKLVDEVMSSDRLIGLVATTQQDIENPGPNDLYTVGTAATIHRMFRAPDGTIRLVIQGIARFKITEFIQQEPYLKAIIEPHPEINESSLEEEALARNVRDQFQHIAEMIPSIPSELVGSITAIQDPLQTAYTIANFQRMDLEDGQNLLELDSSLEKLKTLVSILLRESEVLELGQKIQNEAREEIDKVQREYFLREQLKAIQKELGEGDEQSADIEDFKTKIVSSQMPEEAEKLAKRELDRLSRLPSAAAEYGVIRTFLEWLVSLPWSKTTIDNLDIQHAREILDKDHYGLEDVKERIIEFLAVRKLHKERGDFEELKEIDEIRRDREGVILCFVGPPGVGKTSLGKSIASALGRKFIRISLGGVRDEAEIRGHRRTYIGAMPGRVIQSIRRVETKNPVFMLDEIDKLGSDFRGDPASALLEVLDPEQNNEFRDNYLEAPFDLSQVMFITTANQLGTIPTPLLDRMEVIFLAGYTENEKLNIAQKYLIPRQLRENSLHNNEIQFANEAIYSIIRMYTKEAGVRNLEREIGNICRKVATKITEGKNDISEITPLSVKEFLGKPKYFETEEIVRRTSFPGVATGLAWTPVGGDILFIEATKMVGNKSFTITGSIGKVMQESAQIALSVLRSKSEELNIDPELFSKIEIHLHVPAGAQPKDGPSAGITMFTALASLFSNRLVKPDLAMTGEISLKGQVLPVGGIKEKVLAAHRSGIKTILLPKLNQLDFEDIPDEVKESVNFIFVDTIDEVLDVALEQDNTSNK